MAKQDWIVTIKITETEGDSTATQLWYSPRDVEALIRTTFTQSGPIRDLKIESIKAEEDGRSYV